MSNRYTPAIPAPQRFWPKVDMSGECWLWMAAKFTDGYGEFWDGHRYVLAHRWAYEQLVGPFPPGFQSDHLCRNRACVNPTHIEPVTQRENVLRGVGIGAVNARKVCCLNGHPFDDVNTWTRKNGWRACRTCQRERDARRRPGKKLERVN